MFVSDMISYAKITFATSVVQFICLRFSLRFSAIEVMTAGYDLCVYIKTAIGDFFDGYLQQTGAKS